MRQHREGKGTQASKTVTVIGAWVPSPRAASRPSAGDDSGVVKIPENPKHARLLSIAGSDSSGGAGIQADIKTASALGAYAMTAITAVTAQDTTGVGSIHLVPAAIVSEQIERSLSDIGADAIKTGMLGSPEIATSVAATLQRHATGIPLVVDPVMVSSSGVELAGDAVMDVLKASLFPLASLITPNLPEAERLCGFSLQSGDELLRAGRLLLSLGPRAVLLKGGHGGSETLTDLLFTPDASP